MKRREFLKRSVLSAAALGFGTAVGCQSFAAPTSKRRPNILFCIADDASYPHMSAYGCSWINTPGFDRVAKNGIIFTNAYTPNAKCAPSRACIITGRNSWQLEEAANHEPFFPKKFTTFPEVLKEHGYFTGFTGKGWAPGNPGQMNGKPRQLLGPSFRSKTIKPPARGISNCDYAANFADFIDQKPDDQPFCFWYGGHEPHRGYEFASGINKGGKNIDQVDRVFSFWPDNKTTRTDMLDYAFELEYFDSHLVKILDLLELKGELDNTLVIVTADNGMPFPRIKGQEYEYSNHLPLAMMWKNGLANPGRTVDDFVSFIDFAPTFLKLAGVNPDHCPMHPIQGRDLLKIIRSPKSGHVDPKRDHVIFGKERHDVGRPNDQGYPIRGIVKDDFLFVINFEPSRWPAGNPDTGYLNCDGSPTKTLCIEMGRDPETRNFWRYNFAKRPDEELFNIKSDPDCMHNLADNPEFAAAKAKLKAQLLRELNEQNDPRMAGNGEIFDNYPYASSANRNFYNRYKRGEEMHAGWVNKSDFDPNALNY